MHNERVFLSEGGRLESHPPAGSIQIPDVTLIGRFRDRPGSDVVARAGKTARLDLLNIRRSMAGP
jgi:hypothetical protein